MIPRYLVSVLLLVPCLSAEASPLKRATAETSQCDIDRSLGTRIRPECQPGARAEAKPGTKAGETGSGTDEEWTSFRTPAPRPTLLDASPDDKWEKNEPSGMEMSMIAFSVGSWHLSDVGKRILKQVARTMLDSPDAIYRIEGHASADGDDDGNMTLSEKRANSVVDALVSYGVPKGRLEPEAFGETRPLPSLSPYDPYNRRVTFMPIVMPQSTSR